MTRILQESLGGNSRTTLIINCSPASYNEAETLSTLRFGMRAKSIKNQARVNKELSLPELKVELKRTKEFVSRLEHEVGRWRSGQQVDRSEWASSSGSGNAPAAPAMPATPTNSSRGPTPVNALIDGLKDGSSRPMTPGGVLDKDEREDFFRRENELNDQLAEKVLSPDRSVPVSPDSRLTGSRALPVSTRRKPRSSHRRRPFASCARS